MGRAPLHDILALNGFEVFRGLDLQGTNEFMKVGTKGVAGVKGSGV